jgi:hypothetical protein
MRETESLRPRHAFSEIRAGEFFDESGEINF